LRNALNLFDRGESPLDFELDFGFGKEFARFLVCPVMRVSSLTPCVGRIEADQVETYEKVLLGRQFRVLVMCQNTASCSMVARFLIKTKLLALQTNLAGVALLRSMIVQSDHAPWGEFVVDCHRMKAGRH
jgi:hypothetical protein